MVAQEIIPNIEGDKNALKDFASEILERFFNPFIRHFLEDISLNSLSKWMTRDYPSLMDGLQRTGQLPAKVSFSLAALLVLYRGKYNNLEFTINDTPEHVAFIQNEWIKMESYNTLTSNILSNKAIWNTDLSAVEGLSTAVARYIEAIMVQGIESTLKQII